MALASGYHGGQSGSRKAWGLHLSESEGRRQPAKLSTVQKVEETPVSTMPTGLGGRVFPILACLVLTSQPHSFVIFRSKNGGIKLLT